MASEPPPAPPSKHFLLNFIAVSLFGTLALIWIARFTSLFEVIGGLLGAGGVLVGAAALYNLAPENQILWLRQNIVGRVLDSQGFAGIVVAVALLTFFGTSFLGSVEVESAPGNTASVVWVNPADRPSTDEDREFLGTGSPLRLCRLVGFSRQEEYRVKVQGLPDQVVTLRPWHCPTLSVPNSFLRPLVLITADETLVNQADLKELRLVVTLDGKNVHGEVFDGHPLWIGCESCELPGSCLQKWAGALEQSKVRDLLLSPRSTPQTQVKVLPGAVVTARLLNVPDGKDYTKAIRHVVLQTHTIEDMVQEMKLQVP